MQATRSRVRCLRLLCNNAARQEEIEKATEEVYRYGGRENASSECEKEYGEDMRRWKQMIRESQWKVTNERGVMKITVKAQLGSVILYLSSLYLPLPPTLSSTSL